MELHQQALIYFVKSGACTVYIAINRKENKEQTDFINCVAFGKLAETIKTYTEKGNRIIVTGSLHLDNYTAQDGTTKTSCNVIVDDFYFVDFKQKEKTTENPF